MIVTGDAAVQHDVASALTRALRVGELYLAVPAALLILLLVFGSGSALLPFVFAAFTIPPALGLAWAFAHVLELSDYLLNMVMMIGLGIAIDYSLLVVNRYRDERRERPRAPRGGAADDGARRPDDRRSAASSSRSASALMLLLPVPFLRGFGLGGLLVPASASLCALTLLPVLLARPSASGSSGLRLVPRPAGASAERRPSCGSGRATPAGSMRRAKCLAPAVALVLVVAALPLDRHPRRAGSTRLACRRGSRP